MSNATHAGWRFRPGPVITLATLAFCVLTLFLGNWQAGRAEEKRALQAAMEQRRAAAVVMLTASQIDPEAIEWHRVRARGIYEPRFEVLLDNKVHEGRAGFHVLTPLRIARSGVEGIERYVLVNRGWIAAGRLRENLPEAPIVAGEIEVEGVAVRPNTRYLELESGTRRGKLWQNLDLDAYARWSGLAVQPIVIQQRSDSSDGLVRVWQDPSAGVEKHVAYSWQWYSFCALALILYVGLNLKRRELKTS